MTDHQLLEAILQKVTAIEEDQQATKEEIGHMKADMGLMKEEIGLMKADMGLMKEEIGFVKEEIGHVRSEFKEDFKLVKAQLNENTDLIRAIIDRQEETDVKLESLTKDVHKIHGEITSLKHGQKRQDKILASLAMRSLEQETDLRELKRI